MYRKSGFYVSHEATEELVMRKALGLEDLK